MAVATLVGDLSKGLVPVLIAPLVTDWAPFQGIVALVAFCGHCWSAYLNFQGGKGVATATGAMLPIAPLATGLAAATWIGVVMLTKRSSVAALVGSIALSGFIALLHTEALWIAITMSLGVLLRHRKNIHALATGQAQ